MFRLLSILSALCLLGSGAANAQDSSFNANSTKAPEITQVLATGPASDRFDIVVIGDGFRDGADQTLFNDYVQNEVIDDLLSQGVLWHTRGAFNVHRINTFSRDSGVTQVDSDGEVTDAQRTSLDWRDSATWARCWNERGPNQSAFQNEILDDLAPNRDVVVVVLNTANFGACARGTTVTMHLPTDARVVRHELGHAIGNLCDEYVASDPEDYTGDEPGCVNLTTNISPGGLKWRRYATAGRALPTTFDGATMNQSQTVGAFVGGTRGAGNTFDTGIWHPTFRSTMNNNIVDFGPVNYAQMRLRLADFVDFDFENMATGDFTGDGRDDLVIQAGQNFYLYRSTGNHLDTEFVAGGSVPGWEFQEGDQLLVGDFNGDGLDDIFVVNLNNWSMPYLGMLRSTGTEFRLSRRYDRNLPGWDEMRAADQFYVADFSGDGRDDLLVFNARNWNQPYLGMLRSTGSGLSMSRRYDSTMPGWEMRSGDVFMPGDFNGDGRDDLYVANTTNWSQGYVGMLRSDGNRYRFQRRYDGDLPGWAMRRGDRFTLADVNGDNRDEFYVFNARDWRFGYLGALRSEGSSLSMARRHDESIPGWDLILNGDQLYAADFDGDGDDDLYVYNHADWDSEYLGMLQSNAGRLSGSWQKDRIGQWNLRDVDQFLIGNFNGQAGWDDIFVYNEEWLGMLRSQRRSVNQDAIFKDWINNVEHHDFGWW